jgi:pyruvate,orthophosphate dikinase
MVEQKQQNRVITQQPKGKKWVYTFAEGNVTMTQILGGKGANLADMTKIGLPVPPGFTITTEVCDYFYKNGKKYPQELRNQIDGAIVWLEQKTGMKFGDSRNPLLVSVRSGAAKSMPGMMDTILNLGLNEQTLAGMITLTKNERFCLDSYRRFIQMFGDVVMEVEHHKFKI